MTSSSPLSVDVSKEEAVLQILPRAPLFTSHPCGSDRIQIQYHRMPAWEMPEHCFTQHVIIVNHLAQIKSERQLDERIENEQKFNGDVVIIPAQVPHKSTWQEEGNCTLLMLKPTYIDQVADEAVNGDHIELIPQFAKPDPLIHGIGLTLKSVIESQEQCSPLYIDSLTTALASHLIQHYCTRIYTLPTNACGLAKHCLQQTLDYIHASLDQTISLAALANLLGMSQYHFCKSFKQSMGMAPYQYVMQQRVERAKQLLKQKDLPIAEIALQCGFSDQSHFTKQFRQLTGGITPKAYREI